jgi:hypothetical protein
MLLTDSVNARPLDRAQVVLLAASMVSVGTLDILKTALARLQERG